MIVIVEGIDRVGKTTFCNKLAEKGFLYLKDSSLLYEDIKCKSYMHTTLPAAYMIGKLDTTCAFFKRLDEQGIDVVMDRCHLTELVYSYCEAGRRSFVDLVFKIDAFLAHLGALLVYIQPEDLDWSSRQAGENLASHNEHFEKIVTESSIKKKMMTTFSLLDATVSAICENKSHYDFYFASPFFSEEQIEREEALKGILRSFGFSVFSPKEAFVLSPDASQEERADVFQMNCETIKNSRAVFAITDGKDIGTIWEAGYAYALKKPIVYFAETLGNNKFNVMLSQSGNIVFTDRSMLKKELITKAIEGKRYRFTGIIE
jgi:nucleoside deoxyribosyltransferase